MSISAKLYLDNKEYNILKLETKISQETNHSGRPYGIALGGYFDIVIETTRESNILEWMLQSDGLKDVKIVIPSRFGTSASRKIDLKDTYCIKYNNSFTGTTSTPMTTSFRLSPGGVYENGEAVSIKHWHKVKPEAKNQPKEDEEKEEKKLILTFDADNTDIKNAKFGFDKFDPDFKNIYKGADFSKLQNEYNPIQVYGEKYFPVWVSMRKGQTITLKLDEIKRKNYKLFNEIKFDSNSDFTFEPANLKDASEVHITCNNSGSQKQIKVEGDGEIVGAINFFYPEVKTVSLDWRLVEITGKGKDKNSINSKIDIIKLNTLLKKAFNPMLIDFNIENENPKTADLSKESFIGMIYKVGETEYILKSRKSSFVASIEKVSIPSATSLTLYLVNRLCMDKGNAEVEDGSYEVVAGFSQVNSGVAYGILADREGKILPEAVAHEIMHALGLEHTFAQQNGHAFEPKRTKNYMDYSSDKIYTWKWQWEIARNNKLLK
jgi:hypothetical protein